MTIYSPADFNELRCCLWEALYHTDGPCAVRYPRGTQPHLRLSAEGMRDFCLTAFGEQPVQEFLMVTYGRIGGVCEAACASLEKEGISVRLLRLIKIHPIPPEAMEMIEQAQKLLFVEEGMRTGGISEQIVCSLSGRGKTPAVQILAVDQFVPQNTISGALQSLGMDEASIASQVKKMLFNNFPEGE